MEKHEISEQEALFAEYVELIHKCGYAPSHQDDNEYDEYVKYNKSNK